MNEDEKQIPAAVVIIIAAALVALILLIAAGVPADAAGKQPPPPDNTVKVWPPQWHKDMMYCYYVAPRQALKRPPAVCARGSWVGKVQPAWKARYK